MPCISPGVWNANTLTCNCSASTPYLNANGNCVSCSAPQFWNCKTKQCMSCPNTFEYNSTLKRCVCPINKPFQTFNNTCVPCDPTHWDSRNRKCVVCTSDQVFDPKQVQCTCLSSKPYLAANGSCIICNLPQVWDVGNSACHTPCSANTHFDTISLQCISCPNSFVYDTILLKCKCPDSTPNLNSAGICVNCQPPQSWN